MVWYVVLIGSFGVKYIISSNFFLLEIFRINFKVILCIFFVYKLFFLKGKVQEICKYINYNVCLNIKLKKKVIFKNFDFFFV